MASRSLPATSDTVRAAFALPVAIAALGFAATFDVGWRQSSLFAVALVIGFTLHRANFGFSGAYRALILRGEVAGLRAQALMIAIATLLFAPVLAAGEAFGLGMHGAVAPIGLSVVVGAAIFGIGMQLGGGCGSGTLFTLGGGSTRMAITLVMFCIGGFWASLDWPFWSRLPAIDAIVLGERLGWPAATLLQVGALIGAWILLGGRGHGREAAQPKQRRSRPYAAWPLAAAAALLALLNFATLILSGGPWSITWGFTLVAAKAALALGWDPAAHLFWQDEFQSAALRAPLARDVVVVMDVAILTGAMAASILAGRFAPTLRLPPGTILASILGGLMLGYGSRISFGCNIGAFFSGAASTSLHGWLWLLAALAGTWFGVRLRPLFGFQD